MHEDTDKQGERVGSEVPDSGYLAELMQGLGSFLPEFAPETAEERQELRHRADPERLKEFHSVVVEELDSILAVLDHYAPDKVPQEWRQVANAVLFLAEVDSPVVKWLPRWGIPELPDALDPRHFELKRSFYDSLESEERTRMAQQPQMRTRQGSRKR